MVAIAFCLSARSGRTDGHISLSGGSPLPTSPVSVPDSGQKRGARQKFLSGIFFHYIKTSARSGLLLTDVHKCASSQEKTPTGGGKSTVCRRLRKSSPVSVSGETFLVIYDVLSRYSDTASGNCIFGGFHHFPRKMRGFASSIWRGYSRSSVFPPYFGRKRSH